MGNTMYEVMHNGEKYTYGYSTCGREYQTKGLKEIILMEKVTGRKREPVQLEVHETSKCNLYDGAYIVVEAWDPSTICEVEEIDKITGKTVTKLYCVAVRDVDIALIENELLRARLMQNVCRNWVYLYGTDPYKALDIVGHFIDEYVAKLEAQAAPT